MFCSILYIAKSYENRPRYTKRECTSPFPFRRDDIFTIKSAMKPSEVRRRRRTIIAFSSHLHGITDTVLLSLRGKRESCNSHDRIRLEMELPSERQRCSSVAIFHPDCFRETTLAKTFVFVCAAVHQKLKGNQNNWRFLCGLCTRRTVSINPNECRDFCARLFRCRNQKTRVPIHY